MVYGINHYRPVETVTRRLMRKCGNAALELNAMMGRRRVSLSVLAVLYLFATCVTGKAQADDSVPGLVQNVGVTVKDATTIDVKWQPPSHKGQDRIIRGYLIFFQPINDRNEVVDDTYKFNIMDGTATQYAATIFTPDTLYNVQVGAYNRFGDGELTKMIKAKTFPRLPVAPALEVPSPPEDVRVAALNDTHAEVQWRPIREIPTNRIQGYKVYFGCIEESEPVEKSRCAHAGSVDVENGRDGTLAVLSNLKSGRNYTVTVAAKTGKSVGPPSEPVVFRMAPDEVPRDAHVINITTDSITLRWKPPLLVIPERYIVSWSGKKTYLDQDGSFQIRKMPKGTMETTSTEITLHHLRSHTTYSIGLVAVPQDGRETPALLLEVKTPDAPPPFLPDFTTVTKNGKIRIQLKRASEELGRIKNYLLVVVPSQLATKPPDDYTVAELTQHELASGQPENFCFPYIAANFSRESLPTLFDLGDDNVYGLFRNRPIIPGQHYKVFVRAYVESPSESGPWYSSSRFSEDISTNRRPKPEVTDASQMAVTANMPAGLLENNPAPVA